jgi:hypothetical protein
VPGTRNEVRKGSLEVRSLEVSDRNEVPGTRNEVRKGSLEVRKSGGLGQERGARNEERGSEGSLEVWRSGSGRSQNFLKLTNCCSVASLAAV